MFYSEHCKLAATAVECITETKTSIRFFLNLSSALFCSLCIKFKSCIFQNLCGTEPHPVRRLSILFATSNSIMTMAKEVNINTLYIHISKVRFRAKKYKINEKFFTLADFKWVQYLGYQASEAILIRHMMTHLPEPVSEQDIMEMFRSQTSTWIPLCNPV